MGKLRAKPSSESAYWEAVQDFPIFLQELKKILI